MLVADLISAPKVAIDSRMEQISQFSIEYLKGEGGVNGLRLGYRPLAFHFTTLAVIGDANMHIEASTNFWQCGQPS